MKIFCFVTHCDSWLRESFGNIKLINSLKYFHPNAEIVNLDENDINKILSDNPGFCRVSMMPLTMIEAKKRTNADIIVHLDSDSIVLDTLDEILEGDYDIASVRNNSDKYIGFNPDERPNRPNIISHIPNERYLNCGCVCASFDFLNEWYNLNNNIIQKYGNIKVVKMVELDTMNVVIHTSNSKFKLKILDPISSNCFYGLSANMCAHPEDIAPSITKEYGGNFTDWGSWKDIEYKNGKFWLYGKRVVIVHAGGGGAWKNNQKLHWDRFNPAIIPKLQEITGCKE